MTSFVNHLVQIYEAIHELTNVAGKSVDLAERHQRRITHLEIAVTMLAAFVLIDFVWRHL